ncbi:hypothetical protein B484DRAFT_234869 [Ochromonadaceae sp. CCMP2298]|nr:hypothetical protein B484DRAFT_234869 [Ochromonadaceae sp. CCMP2298]
MQRFYSLGVNTFSLVKKQEDRIATNIALLRNRGGGAGKAGARGWGLPPLSRTRGGTGPLSPLGGAYSVLGGGEAAGGGNQRGGGGWGRVMGGDHRGAHSTTLHQGSKCRSSPPSLLNWLLLSPKYLIFFRAERAERPPEVDKPYKGFRKDSYSR